MRVCGEGKMIKISSPDEVEQEMKVHQRFAKANPELMRMLLNMANSVRHMVLQEIIDKEMFQYWNEVYDIVLNAAESDKLQDKEDRRYEKLYQKMLHKEHKHRKEFQHSKTRDTNFVSVVR